MRDLALSSPLLLCILVVVVGAAASLLPMSPVEPVLVAVAAVAPTWLLVPIIALATASHMSTKMLVFLGGKKVEGALKGRARERFDRARLRLADNPRLQHGTLLLSSVTGLPPFYVITALCGSLRMPTREFVVLATTGRAIRFTMLVLAPQLFRPAPAGAQHAPPPAVRVVGAGPETFVLLSGMVGGVASFRRIETRLVAQGFRVVSIDPYQLAIDSTVVTFDAIARLVDAELGARAITGATVVGHSHGGGVGLRLAGNAPTRVSRLYLLDVGALPSNRSAVFSASIRFVPIISRIPTGNAFIRNQMVAGLRENSATAEWLDESTRRAYTEPLIENVDRVVAMAMRLGQAEEPEPVANVVARVRAPITILLGETATKAGPAPGEFQAFGRRAPPLRIDTVRRAGHFPHEEAPDEVVRLLRTRQVVAVAARRERP
ncbi:MAG: alpha/beta fold hydrolase [Gemmatimonadaceae bacterium]